MCIGDLGIKWIFIRGLVLEAPRKLGRSLTLELIHDPRHIELTNRATGYLTGDQSRQTEGNLEAEKASVDYKQAKTGNPLAVPIPSAEGVKGKMESVAGMVTGDQELQKEGNAKAEAAAWKDGN